MNKSDVIDMTSEIGEEIANPLSAIAVLLELPSGLDDTTLVLVSATAEGFDLNRLIVAPFHRGLVIERVDVARAPIHEQEDHAFCLGGEMGLW